MRAAQAGSIHLKRDFIIVIAILSVAIITPVVYLSSQARQNISSQYIKNATENSVSQFHNMDETMVATLELVADWGRDNLLPLSQGNEINSLLFPLLEREKMLYGISIADMNGASYYIRHEGENIRTSEIEANSSPRESKLRLLDSKRQMLSEKMLPSHYDPRQRPWFEPAVSNNTIFWTEPYTFYSSDNVGMTAAISYTRKSDGKQLVVAFDILLDDLYLKIHKTAPSQNSRVFIFRQDAKLYIPKSVDSGPDFLSFATIKDEAIRQAYTTWSGAALSTKQILTIRNNNKTWWCGFQPLENTRKNTWICVMVPEDDIIGNANKRQITIWLLGLAAILCCTALAAWLLYRHARPASIANTVMGQKNPEESVHRLIAEGEGRTIEFKSTMRMNLHTGKKGKEIEIAWLKGVAAFLNSEGGILLLGVADNGEITGLGKDNFDNDDRCALHLKNLIGAHIGTEFSKYIQFNIVQVGDKKVGVISCERSATPIFLKHPKGESFFIRNGPSSDELPISKALEYIKQRH